MIFRAASFSFRAFSNFAIKRNNYELPDRKRHHGRSSGTSR
jgi:hypothetical protein